MYIYFSCRIMFKLKSKDYGLNDCQLKIILGCLRVRSLPLCLFGTRQEKKQSDIHSLLRRIILKNGVFTITPRRVRFTDDLRQTCLLVPTVFTSRCQTSSLGSKKLLSIISGHCCAMREIPVLGRTRFQVRFTIGCQTVGNLCWRKWLFLE